jgi:DNA-binding beta-propeller fold protein YncE
MKRIAGILWGAFLLGVCSGSGQTPQSPSHNVADPGVVTTHQAITPAGVQAVFLGHVYAVSFCGSDDELAVAVQQNGTLGVYRLSVSTNRIVETYEHKLERPGIQGLACVPDTKDLLLTISGSEDGEPEQAIRRLSGAKPTAANMTGTLSKGGIGSVSVSGDARLAVAALTGSNEVAVVDLNEKKIERRIRVSIAPFAGVVNRDGTVAWVSNWGGRFAKDKERTAPTGPAPDADRVLIDERGVANSGTVSRVDLTAGRVTDEIAVGLHPTALAWDEARHRLYVASTNSDSISVVDTNSQRAIENWEIQPFSHRVSGVAPTSIALSPDGTRLYAACGGINAVAVISTERGEIEGLIPTAWYPAHVAVSPSGKTLAVSTLLGVGSGSDLSDETLKAFRQELPSLQPGIRTRYVHAYRGTVHIVSIPEPEQLKAYSRAVAENNHLQLQATVQSRAQVTHPLAMPLPVPEHAGDPSLIEHVVYIVKENRTYDQILGDLERGNGDRSLALYGEDVTPNHHKLAREFVVLDNFYATGGNSGDGHQWVTQAAETDYAYWPGYDGRSYPFDGNDPIAYARSGFLWDAALKAGKKFADFGEFIPMGQYEEFKGDPIQELKAGPKSKVTKLRSDLLQQWKDGEQFVDRFQVRSPIPPLDAHLVREFPSYGNASPDVVRARIFLRHLREWEQQGAMPNLLFLQLPSDHTGGTTPGFCTPRACIADNDLALGQIVEGISHSKFWPKTAIFVVEDDAQAGVDHVDGHRTVALVVSPYAQRKSVDSTFYSHPSITKTIELMLGLPNLSLFDLIADDMRNSFSSTADLTPYSAVQPRQSLFDVNPPVQALKGQSRKDALESAGMNWQVPDAAPSEKLNRILWRREHGSAPYPGAKHALLAPYAIDIDKDEDVSSERQKVH